MASRQRYLPRIGKEQSNHDSHHDDVSEGKEDEILLPTEEDSFMKILCPYHIVVGSWRWLLTAIFFARVYTVMFTSNAKHFGGKISNTPQTNGTQTDYSDRADFPCGLNVIPDVATLLFASCFVIFYGRNNGFITSAMHGESSLTLRRFIYNFGAVHLVFAGFGAVRCFMANPVTLIDRSLFKWSQTISQLIVAWQSSHPEVEDGDLLSIGIRFTHVLRVYAALFAIFSNKSLHLQLALGFIMLSVPIDNLLHRYFTPDEQMCYREQFLEDWDRQSYAHVLFHATTMVWVNMYTLVVGVNG